MLPFLRHLEDGDEHSLRDTEEALAKHFNLAPAERATRHIQKPNWLGSNLFEKGGAD
jgi:hypothetical protein